MRNLIMTDADIKTKDQKVAIATAVYVMHAVRGSHKYGFNLDEPTTEIAYGAKALIAVGDDNNKRGGFAFVMPDGEIKCLCGQGGVFDDLVRLALAAGGTWLTCYDIKDITLMYARHGFYITKREVFDPVKGSHVPRYVGEPDFVTMSLNPHP